MERGHFNKFWLENRTKRDYLRDRYLNVRVKLERILQIQAADTNGLKWDQRRTFVMSG
jgi:hypothetical protein